MDTATQPKAQIKAGMEPIKRKFQVIVRTTHQHIYSLIGEPERLHIVKTGFKDQYLVFWEDAYEMEPWRSGIMSLCAATILKNFGIKV